MNLFTYDPVRSLAGLMALPSIEDGEQGKYISLASRIMEAETLSDVADISNEEILGLIPQLNVVFSQMENLGDEQKQASARLSSVLPVRRRRKLL